eukprot:352020-Prorocentrum_minimum.AAC.1
MGHMLAARANGVRGRGICLRREPMARGDGAYTSWPESRTETKLKPSNLYHGLVSIEGARAAQSSLTLHLRSYIQARVGWYQGLVSIKGARTAQSSLTVHLRSYIQARHQGCTHRPVLLDVILEVVHPGLRARGGTHAVRIARENEDLQVVAAVDERLVVRAHVALRGLVSINGWLASWVG